MLRTIALSLSLALPACTYVSGDAKVLITSTPPGADILVDGQETQLTTPARIELDAYFGENHLITLRMDGHDPESREVVHRRVWTMSRWIDGTDIRTLPNPLEWTFGDFFTPFAVRYQYIPGELHVVMYAEGEGPVKSEQVIWPSSEQAETPPRP